MLIFTVIVATGLTVLSAGRVWAGPVPPVRSERELPEGLLTKPVVIYNRPYTAAIYSDYVPSEEEVQSPFEMVMAGNEYEPIQVGLYVPSDKTTLQDVSLQVKCDIPSQIGRIHYSPSREHRWAGAEDKPRPKGGWVWPVDRKLLVDRREHMPTFVIPRSDIEAIEPELSGNVSWDSSHLYSSGTLSVIPEPATLTLLAVGTLLTCGRRRRYRQ